MAVYGPIAFRVVHHFSIFSASGVGIACTGDWITKPMQSNVSKKERNRTIFGTLETLRLTDKNACA